MTSVPSPVGMRHTGAYASHDAERTVAMADAVRTSQHRRVPAKPPIRGNTVVTTTAALGAVVTGTLMGADPGHSANTADADEASTATGTMAAASKPLRIAPASAATSDLDPKLARAAAHALAPVAIPGNRVASATSGTSRHCTRASAWPSRPPPCTPPPSRRPPSWPGAAT